MRNYWLRGAVRSSVWCARNSPTKHKMKDMKRVVILGRGASGKSTLAKRLGEITGLPVSNWTDILATGSCCHAPREWVAVQQELIAGDSWILDGDLGPYDAVEVRLRAADTIIFLDFSLIRCAWWAFLRSPERTYFWRWLLAYRFQSRPILLAALASTRTMRTLRCFAVLAHSAA